MEIQELKTNKQEKITTDVSVATTTIKTYFPGSIVTQCPQLLVQQFGQRIESLIANW
jgi:hypothetical protein